MIIQEDNSDSEFQIKAYSPGQITINKNVYTKSLIVMASKLIDNWEPQTLESLQQNHLNSIISLKPDIVLLGTGKKFKVPNSNILNIFYNENIGIEYMDTGAACRTYVALLSEGRNVLAALLIE